MILIKVREVKDKGRDKDTTTQTKMQKNNNKEASGKTILIKVREVKDNFNSGSVISPHSI